MNLNLGKDFLPAEKPRDCLKFCKLKYEIQTSHCYLYDTFH